MLDRIKNFIDNIGQHDQRPADPTRSIFLEAENNGHLPFNTASVKLKAYNDSTKSQRLNNISVQWFRHFEGRNYALENIEDSYNFSSEDLGARIIGVVTDNDRPNIFESASFGPVCLDPACKADLEGLFKAGKAIFEVQLPHAQFGNDLLLRPPEFKNASKFVIDEVALTPESLTFVHSKGANSSVPLKGLRLEAVESHPLLVLLRTEERLPELEFLEQRIHVDSGSWFYVKFFNRVFREDFLLLAKLFCEVKGQPFANQLAAWEGRGVDKGFFSAKIGGILNVGSSAFGELLLQIERLREALGRNVSYTKAVIEERNSLMEYSEGLERDLKATLKDLKELVIKQKLHEHVDFSKLEKVEGSILDFDRRRQENNLGKSENGVSQVRFQKLQEEKEKLEKLNKALLKELNGFREKRKEKIRTINQSLNALNREIASQAQNLNLASAQGNTNKSLDVSKYLENLNTDTASKSMAKKERPLVLEEKSKQNEFLIREEKNQKSRQIEKNPEIEISILVTQKAELSQKVNSLQKKIDEYESLLKSQNIPVDPFFERQFNEIRDLIGKSVFSRNSETEENEKEAQKDPVLEQSFVELIRKVAETNKNELLNTENQILSNRNSYLLGLLKSKNSGEIFEEPNTEIYKSLQTKIESLKRENERLFSEIEDASKNESNGEVLLKKQNLVLKNEFERLLKENQSLKEKTQEVEAYEAKVKAFEGELENKERVLQSAIATNRTLAEEINRLQAVINAQEESLNLSSAKE